VDTNIYRPVPVERDMLLARYGLKIGQRPRIILCISRLEAGKGVFFLADALAGRQDVLLVFLGEGPELNKLKRYPHVRCIGFIADQDEKNRWLCCADVVALPSFYENFPLVVCEALAAGRPIVATRVGMVPELLGHREHRLVQPGNSLELCHKIEGLLTNSQLARSDELRNRNYAEKNLDWRAITQTYVTLYRQAIHAARLH
jgi:glycosyltransferase involved in cell wall biosynthesis